MSWINWFIKPKAEVPEQPQSTPKPPSGNAGGRNRNKPRVTDVTVSVYTVYARVDGEFVIIALKGRTPERAILDHITKMEIQILKERDIAQRVNESLE